MSDYYNRYEKFTAEGQVYAKVPFVAIETSSTDLFITYEKSKMRMDTLSYKYYGDPNYGWLILQANPKYGPYEYSIKDKVHLRIPYPLDSAINRYESAANKWMNEHDTSELV